MDRNPIMSKLQSIGEIADGIKSELKSRKEGDTNRFKTDFNELDNVIIAIRKKRLYVIGGRTGDGKTTLMCNIAANLADKHARVMFFSLEMRKEDIVQRLICRNQRIDYQMFEFDYLTEKMAQDIEGFKKFFADAKFVVVDSFGYQFAVLAEFIESLLPKPDVIFIDHIQMVSSKGYKSKYEAISEYIRKLKELALTQDMAIVVASQINRQGAGIKPSVIHLKESGAIEESADCVLLCYWPFNSGDSNERSKYEILIGKNRFGKVLANTGIELEFIPSRYEFKNKKH